MVARGWKLGNRELLLNGGRVSVLQDEEFWRGVGAMATQSEAVLNAPICSLKSAYNGKFYILCVLPQ